MNRKKLFVTGMATLCVLGVPAAAGAQGKVPESIQFEEAAHLIPGLGSTYDAAAALEISGDDANEEIIFSTYDDFRRRCDYSDWIWSYDNNCNFCSG